MSGTPCFHSLGFGSGPHPADRLSVGLGNGSHLWTCERHAPKGPTAVVLTTGPVPVDRAPYVLGKAGLLKPYTSEVVLNYGGGVNSVAAIIYLVRRLKIRPRLVLMADPGREWPETHAYREEVMNPWLVREGMDPVVVVSRASEAVYRPRAELRETLLEDCIRKKMLPSAAYGHSSCSYKYKQIPARWYMERQPWAQALWAKGERIRKVIGYDAGESHRFRPDFAEALENRCYFPDYPLVDADLDRDDCIELIRSEGIQEPRKSACVFCPNNTIDDWIFLRETHPDLYAEAVALSELAYPGLESEAVGLMRCNPSGKRQLHLWDGQSGGSCETPQQCACAY